MGRFAASLLAALPILALVFAPAAAEPRDNGAALQARPAAPSRLDLPAGESRLANRSIVYRPATFAEGPRPLPVNLHGHSQSPDEFIRLFERWADRCDAILIAPVAEKITWDIIATAQELETRATRPSRPPMRFGNDTRRIDKDLGELFRLAPIDAKRVALLGFSDGASYALSLGLANPDLFPWILSFSPGFAVWPDEVALKQKVFIAHGRRDSRLDFTNTKEGIVGTLRRGGMDVRFREFDGDHIMKGDHIREALELAFGQC